jgi:hypothetical protein
MDMCHSVPNWMLPVKVSQLKKQETICAKLLNYSSNQPIPVKFRIESITKFM